MTVALSAPDPQLQQRMTQAVVARLLQEQVALRDAWQRSSPVQHVVIDGLLPDELVRQVAAEFPSAERMSRRRSIRERKYTSAKLGDWGVAVRACFLALQAPEVLAVMERVTGIRDLSGDHTGYAGGISAMGRGDFLNPHIDNSGHPTYRGYRRLNALFYVSPNWRHEDGGHLELWSESMRDRLEVDARFNRLVVMNTNRQSLHSVNHVQNADRLRLCVSNYYYNPESPVGRAYSHITSFRGRPNERVKDLYLRLEGVLGSAYVRAFPRNVNKS